jgi:hypothetical protein
LSRCYERAPCKSRLPSPWPLPSVVFPKNQVRIRETAKATSYDGLHATTNLLSIVFEHDPRRIDCLRAFYRERRSGNNLRCRGVFGGVRSLSYVDRFFIAEYRASLGARLRYSPDLSGSLKWKRPHDLSPAVLTISSPDAATLAHGLRIMPAVLKPSPISTRWRLFSFQALGVPARVAAARQRPSFVSHDRVGGESAALGPADVQDRGGPSDCPCPGASL